jgi:hypothetical protein
MTATTRFPVARLLLKWTASRPAIPSIEDSVLCRWRSASIRIIDDGDRAEGHNGTMSQDGPHPNLHQSPTVMLKDFAELSVATEVAAYGAVGSEVMVY